MKYIVFDHETTIRDGTPSPFHPDNKTVMVGGGISDEEQKLKKILVEHSLTDPVVGFTEVECRMIEGDYALKVGHNVKFDLHWDARASQAVSTGPGENLFLMNVVARNPDQLIWDTQLAQYLLSGQQSTMISLEDACAKYGIGKGKLNEVSEMFKQGIGADLIDRDLLAKYLERDIRDTDALFREQLSQLTPDNMPLFRSQMEALLCTTHMEWNGMAIDLEALDKLERELQERADKAKEDAAKIANKYVFEALNFRLREWHEGSEEKYTPLEFNINSTSDLSLVLFGGVVHHKVHRQEGYYKNGNKKYRVSSIGKKVDGFNLSPRLYGAEPVKGNSERYTTNQNVIDNVLTVKGPDDVDCFCNALTEYRKCNKIINTFIKGIKENLAVSQTNILHHRLHHTTTHTGRLSSSSPNLQNQPSGEDAVIKEVFVSRWGDEGYIVEADYKQLEVIALAYLSQDQQLIEDIKQGRDIHFETGKRVFGWTTLDDMSSDQRRIVKTINFGLIYGGGAKTLAAQAGVSKVLAQDCINAFYDRYYRVKLWAEERKELFEREATPVHDNQGRVCHTWTETSITGRKYVYTSYWHTDDNGRQREVMPVTKLVNYPVQGLATADIVPMILGKLIRAIFKEGLQDEVKVINTVHDSIEFDVHDNVIADAGRLIKSVMEEAPKYLEEDFGIIDFDLPLKVDITFGPNWKDQMSIEGV